MRFEGVSCPEAGAVRLKDIRSSAGDGFSDMRSASVLYLTPSGLPHREEVALAEKVGGRGVHRQLGCPRCGGPATVLRSDEAGALSCLRCRAHRTQRQLQRGTRWWRLGGEETDRLIRAAQRVRSRNADQLMLKAKRLAQQDAARIDALMPKVEAALNLEDS